MRKTLISFLADCRARGEETWFARWEGLRLARWSYARMAATAWQFARELDARGIAKGERVLFWGENSPEWVAAFFGCMARGVVAVPLDRQSAPAFVARVQAQVNARLLLHGEEAPPDFGAPLPRLALATLSDDVARHSAVPMTTDHIDAGDLIEIIFTSGTTAEPKGVCLTHRNFLTNLDTLEREIAKYQRWERPFHPVRFLSLLPLSHVFGQFMGIFVPHLLAGEVYFRDSLNPSEVFRVIREHRISVLIAFPRLLETLREKIERDAAANGEADFARRLAIAPHQHYLRRWWTFREIHRQFGWKFWAFISGGATLNQETEEFWRRLGYAVIQGYGMTETASVISIPHPFKMVHGSIGKTMPGQEVKLDEKGEILVRGANIAAGYWSADGRIRPITNEDGWLRTGDIGERDEAGNLFYRSRQKDMIATAAGMKIFPEDLEEALDRQPEIRASCVVGVAGARGPEALAALIPSDREADLDAAVRRANESLAEHQRIRRWVVWPESDFPRTTTTQKVIRRLVAETAQQSAGEPSPEPQASSYLLQQIARISGAPVGQAGEAAQLTADLKLDSLGRVELLSALEDRYQVDLDETAFSAATTVAEIEAQIHTRLSEGAAAAGAPYPFPNWPHRAPVTWLRRIAWYLLVRPFLTLMVRLRVEGREHLRGLRGPVIFASNHITMVDPPLILAALPARLRHRLAVAMAGERLRSWRTPPAGTPWFQRLVLRIQYTLVVAIFHVFPLPQKSGFRRSFARAGELADRGFHILIFPEGELTKDGLIHPFQSGTGLLARQLNAPVIPVRIEGLFDLKERRQYFGGRVMIRLGPPLRFSPQAEPAQIVREIEAAVRAL